MASSSPNVCALFIEEWLQRNDKEVLEERIKEWERVNRLREVLSQQELDHFTMVDTFPIVDALIIEKCIDELLHQTIHVSERLSLIEQRLQTHWGSKGQLNAIYNTLYQAIRLEQLKLTIKRMYQEDDLYESYAAYVFEVDQAYRHFMYDFTKLESKEMLEEITSRLTNWYENKFLRHISEEINYKLADGYLSTLMPQQIFAQYIRPILEKKNKQGYLLLFPML